MAAGGAKRKGKRRKAAPRKPKHSDKAEPVARVRSSCMTALFPMRFQPTFFQRFKLVRAA